jgi:hypothetical protein
MAQPYRRGKRWYLKYKDAHGRWQDKACEARTRGEAVTLQHEIEVAEERARHGLETRPPADGGGTIDELIEWWADKYFKRKVSYAVAMSDATSVSLQSAKWTSTERI